MGSQQPFDLPINPLIDSKTGYAVNIPLDRQLPPGWRHNAAMQEVAKRIHMLREKMGITIDDHVEGNKGNVDPTV